MESSARKDISPEERKLTSFKELSGLKAKQLFRLKTKQRTAPRVSIARGIPRIPRGLGFVPPLIPELKPTPIRKRRKRRRERREFVGISEGFTARQLQFKPIKVSTKDVIRLSNIPTGALGIRPAPILTNSPNRKRRRKR